MTALAGSGQITLNWTPVTGAVSYNLYRATTSGAEGSTAYKTGLTGASYVDTPLTNGTGPYYYTLAAVNAVGVGSQSNEASAILVAASASSAVYRVNCGGGAVSPFIADDYFLDGLTSSTTDTIDTSGVSNPAPQAVYTTERFGDFDAAGSIIYQFPGLTPGKAYTARLHFAPATYITGMGISVMNVAINGVPVLTDFDEFTAAGGFDRAVVEQFNVTADNSGRIQISLSDWYGLRNTNISGIEILTNFSSPNTPLNLAASSGNAQIRLTWNAVTGATGYTLYRSTISGSETSYVSGISGTSYTDTVANGTAYFYEVAAVNTYGTGQLSNEAQGMGAASGACVLAINGGGLAAGRFALDQNYDTGSGYSANGAVDLSGVSNPGPAAVYTTCHVGGGTGQAFTYTLHGLTPSTAYTVRLHFADFWATYPNRRIFNVAINGSTVLDHFDIIVAAGAPNKAVIEQFNATSDATGKISVLVTGMSGVYGDHLGILNGVEVLAKSSAPAPPFGVQALVTGPEQITISWNPVVGAVTYNLYRGTASGGETLYKTGLAGSPCIDGAAVDGTTYYYQVTSVNSYGESDRSAEALSQTQACTPPLAPRIVSGYKSDTYDGQITFSSSPGAYEYRVYFSQYATGPYQLFYILEQAYGETLIMHLGSYPGPWHFLVTAVGACGESAYSNTIGMTFGLPSVPEGGSSAWNAVSQNDDSPDSPSAGSWDILNPAGTVIATSGDPSGWTVTDDASSNLVVGAPLSAPVDTPYEVRAKRPDQVTCDGSSFSVILVYPPGGLYAVPGDAQVTLNWGGATGASSYSIYRNTDGGTTFTFVGSTSSISSSYTDTGLTNGKTYYYVVGAVSSGGAGVLSNVVSATPNSPTTTPIALTATSSAGSVSLSWTNTGADTYNLYRGTVSSGEVQYVTGIASNSYTDSGLPDGVEYFYYVTAVFGGVEGVASNEAYAGSTSFALSAAPTTVTIPLGGADTSVALATASGGWQGDVALTVSGVPSGVTAWLYPSTVTLTTSTGPVGTIGLPPYIPVTASGTLHLFVGPTATPGTYTITITGTSGGVTKTQPVTLVVTAS